MEHPDEFYFKEAASEAKKALCQRAKCGSVVVLNDEIIGRGYNAPPLNKTENCQCESGYRDSPKPKSDRTCCMHAEWRSIIDALKKQGDLAGAKLYFTRVDDSGDILFSGEPYCTVCSRLALDTGIAGFGLWHESGIKMYKTDEYNRLSYEFHNHKA